MVDGVGFVFEKKLLEHLAAVISKIAAGKGQRQDGMALGAWIGQVVCE